MPGSFVPTVTAITTSQDLQWLVQPTLISSQASGQSSSTGTTTMTQPVSLVDPYDMPGPSFSSGSGYTPSSSEASGSAPGPMRQSRTRSRRAREESVSEDGDICVLVSLSAWVGCLLTILCLKKKSFLFCVNSDLLFMFNTTAYTLKLYFSNKNQSLIKLFFSFTAVDTWRRGKETRSSREKQAGCCQMQKP